MHSVITLLYHSSLKEENIEIEYKVLFSGLCNKDNLQIQSVDPH